MAHVQPTASGTSNRFEKHLDRLRDHRALGLPVRFYFRRREQLLYLAVGGWNTVFGYGVWAVLQFLLGDRLHYLVILVLAWPIAVLNAYLGYRFIVFRSRGSILRELPRFSLVYVVSLIIGLIALPIALTILPFSIYVVQALLTIAVIIGSYLSHRYFSFGVGRRTGGPKGSSPDLPATSED
jgi:putative flippase GtrA